MEPLVYTAITSLLFLLLVIISNRFNLYKGVVILFIAAVIAIYALVAHCIILTILNITFLFSKLFRK